MRTCALVAWPPPLTAHARSIATSTAWRARHGAVPSPSAVHAPTGTNAGSPLTTAPPHLLAPERSISSGGTPYGSAYSPPLKQPMAMLHQQSWAGSSDASALAPLGVGIQHDARTTLIMVCSPRNAPLPHLADEAVERIARRDTGEYDFALIAPRSSMKYCLEAQREAERAEAAGPDRPAIPAIRLPGQ